MARRKKRKKEMKEGESKKRKQHKLYAAVRIRGVVGAPSSIKNTLHILRLRKKFSCVLIQYEQVQTGMLNKVKDYVSYGLIKSDVLKNLLLERGKKIGNKPLKHDELASKIDDITKDLINFKIKPADLNKFGIKPFFRLHPPRGGFKKETRLPWPKGILGNTGDNINELITKML